MIIDRIFYRACRVLSVIIIIFLAVTVLSKILPYIGSLIGTVTHLIESIGGSLGSMVSSASKMLR